MVGPLYLQSFYNFLHNLIISEKMSLVEHLAENVLVLRRRENVFESFQFAVVVMVGGFCLRGR